MFENCKEKHPKKTISSAHDLRGTYQEKKGRKLKGKTQSSMGMGKKVPKAQQPKNKDKI